MPFASEVIRPFEAADAAGVLAFLDRLSVESRYRRFFGPPSTATLHAVASPDGIRHVALVAIDGRDVVGLASFHVAADDPSHADASVVVADDHQRHGLGTALVFALGRLARRQGVEHLTATVLTDNLAVLTLLRKVAPSAGRIHDGITINVDIPLLPERTRAA